MEKYHQKLGPYHLMVVSQYFEDINDFKNLEYATKKARGNMEKFHFNPIPLTKESIKYFSQLETLHVYKKSDEEFRDEKFYKRIIHYSVGYEQYKIMNKGDEDIFLNVIFDKFEAKEMNKTLPLP